MPVICPATPADIPTIRDLAHRTWPATFGDILSPAQIDYMLERMYAPAALREQMHDLGHAFLLALDNTGQPRAYVSYQFDYLPATTKVHKLYVLPQGQRAGFGRSLLEAVAKTAKQADQRRLRLDVNYQNPAVGFYERLGFRKVDEVTTDIGEGFLMEDYVFELAL